MKQTVFVFFPWFLSTRCTSKILIFWRRVKNQNWNEKATLSSNDPSPQTRIFPDFGRTKDPRVNSSFGVVFLEVAWQMGSKNEAHFQGRFSLANTTLKSKKSNQNRGSWSFLASLKTMSIEEFQELQSLRPSRECWMTNAANSRTNTRKRCRSCFACFGCFAGCFSAVFQALYPDPHGCFSAVFPAVFNVRHSAPL